MGIQRDPTFGPVAMFGLGGVFVEILKDVVFHRCPFGDDVAEQMIRSIKGAPFASSSYRHSSRKRRQSPSAAQRPQPSTEAGSRLQVNIRTSAPHAETEIRVSNVK